MSEMECSECGSDLPNGQAKCSSCGIEIDWSEFKTDPGALFCPQCGEQSVEGAKFCMSCGQSLSIQGKRTSRRNHQTQTVDSQNEPFSESKKKPRILIFIAVFAGVIFLIPLIKWLSVDPDAGRSNSTSPSASVTSKPTHEAVVVKPKNPEFGSIEYYLAQPAQQFVTTGIGLQALNLNLGINLNNGTRPITVKELADQVFSATQQMAGKKLTRNDVDISLQPGGGFYNFFAALLNGPESYQAIVYELLQDGSKNG